MGDFNAKIGSDYKTWAPALGKFELGVMNLDFILVYQGDLKSIKNWSFCSADIGSDHNLVLANEQFQPPKARRIKSVQKSYDVGRFKNPSVAEEL